MQHCTLRVRARPRGDGAPHGTPPPGAGARRFLPYACPLHSSRHSQTLMTVPLSPRAAAGCNSTEAAMRRAAASALAIAGLHLLFMHARDTAVAEQLRRMMFARQEQAHALSSPGRPPAARDRTGTIACSLSLLHYCLRTHPARAPAVPANKLHVPKRPLAPLCRLARTSCSHYYA